jgi:amino-acid N-acetyltransferase
VRVNALVAVTVVRAAHEGDVAGIVRLVDGYARQGLLLARTEASVRVRLADFVVAETDGEIVGCAALSPLGPGLVEVRTLAVREDQRGRGVGRRMVETLKQRAAARGDAEVLALTREVPFFESLGFAATRRELYLSKLQADCAACPRNTCCDETAVVWHPAGEVSE